MQTKFPPSPGEPGTWQAAFTADDAYKGVESSEFYLSLIGRFSLLMVGGYIFYLVIKYIYMPFVEPIVKAYRSNPVILLLIMLLLLILIFFLFSIPFLTVRRFAFRSAKDFFSELHIPPEDFDLKEIIDYRLYGRFKLPAPFSELLQKISQFRYILVKDGEIIGKDWTAWMARNLGGPLLLIVFDGCALYLERGNRFSRVVGPGAPFLEWFETVKYVVDLRPKVREGEFKVWTKDGINVTLRARLECRVGDPNNVALDKNLVYPFDPVAVKKAIERFALRWPDPQKDPEEFTWEDAAWGQVTGIVPSYIGGRMLDDLLVADRRGGQILSPDAMSEIFASLNRATNGFGVYVTNFQILSVITPPEVSAHHIKFWEAERQSIVTMFDGEAKAFNIRTREKVRAQAQRDLILAIVNGLKKNIKADGTNSDTEQFIEPLLMSFSGVLDESLNNPSMRAFLAKDTLEVLEKLQSMLERRP
jgi:regulator of protease activity HflC (stomatin/prohibitin superfamily)